MNIRKQLARLLEGKDLSERESYKAFLGVFRQEIGETDTKALLLLLARKSETLDEILGCLAALRKLEPPDPVSLEGLIDTCGTGGDHSDSVNVSTLAAFVIAGAGGKVAKHGNRSISSRCGSSDLMEALGVNVAASKRKMIQAIRSSGLGYFHAPFHHPVFASVQPLRRRLKTRTIFNFLGPLTNPLKLKGQLIGVARQQEVARFANVLRRTGIQNAFVFCSSDGLDEISSRATTLLAQVQNKKIRYRRLNPKSLGLAQASRGAYRGGSVFKNKKIALALLQGKLQGPIRDIVVLNAAAGLILSGKARDFSEGIRLAAHCLSSGNAYRVLESLRQVTHS